MKVSVIMPLYNKAPFVLEAIESVLSQDFSDLELIVVDDVSTDDSSDKVLQVKDPRLRLFKNERNLGAALCAQRAIDEAQGEYLIRLDADDICMPNRLKSQVEYMDAHPLVGASGGSIQLLGDGDKIWGFPENDEECKAQLLFSVPVSQGASIMRHSVIKEHCIRYAENLPVVGEDWLYWLKWFKVSRFGNLKEPLIQYRRGEHNASFGRDRYKDHQELFHRVFRFFDISLSEEQLELHSYTMKLFRNDPTVLSIRAFSEHLDSLRRMNNEKSIFPKEAFSKRLERSWNELFFYLPKYGKEVVEAYKKISGGLNDKERKYYFRFRLNKILGRA